MAYELFYKYLYPLLQDTDFSFFRLFQYITFRSAYAVVTALILSFIIGPKLIRYLKRKKLGQPIRDDGPETHLNKSGTPTMGGLMILGVIVVSTLIWGRLDRGFILLLLFATVSFGLIGFVDDYKKLILKSSKGLSGKKKLLWQFLFAGIVVFFMSQIIYNESSVPSQIDAIDFKADILNKLSDKQNKDFILSVYQKDIKKNVYLLKKDLSKDHRLKISKLIKSVEYRILPLYLPFIHKPIMDMAHYSFKFTLPFLEQTIYIPYLYFIFGILIIVGSSNAVNLTDGLDGLAIGLLLFVGIAFGILAYVSGNTNVTNYLNIAFIQQAGELTVFCAAFVGASMGFLWFNSHPAQVFMGDTGSLSLGAVIGVLALMIKKEFLLSIVGGIFVLEAFSVIIQVLYYKWKKKRVFKMAPIHHHFELSGWHESKVIIRFWIIGATLALIALSTLKIQ